MNRAEIRRSIGDEIPYRRSTLAKRTGSLVFDKHLNETLASLAQRAEAPDEARSSSSRSRARVT